MSLQKLVVKNYLRGSYRIGLEVFHTPVPTEKRWLPNDLINESNHVVSRKLPIILDGVLDIRNRTGQGFSPRGVPLYLFYPFDESYPPFHVAYKDRGTENLLIRVQFEHWDSGPWPRAGLMRIHGTVGNVEIERRLLQTTFGGIESSDISITELVPNVKNYETIHWDHVFNIDPVMCEDVDDIFAWRYDGDNIHFMIGIADVAAWIAPDSELDIRARKLGETLYDNGTVITSMLPPFISTSAASLRHDGIVRPVIGLVFTIQKESSVITSEWKQYMVTLTDCYSYESICDAPVSIELYELLKKVCYRTPIAEDSHDWVAQAMITYNHAAAQRLKISGLGILRRHAGKKSSDYANLAAVSGCKEIEHLGMAAGEYIVGNDELTEHVGLNLHMYCHASSPLRRYSDLVNQRILKYLLFDSTYFPTDCDITIHLNTRSRAARILEKELWFLQCIKPSEVTVVNGILLNCKDAVKKCWYVYVPVWRRKISGVLFPTDSEIKTGSHVCLRVFCDLNVPNWRNRIICQISDASASAD